MMKINPICERIAHAAARTPRFSTVLFGGNTLPVALALFMLGSAFQRAGETGELRYAETLCIFHTLVQVELILAALLVPAWVAGTVNGGREQWTLDLLLGITLSPRRIIFGNPLQNLVGIGIFALSGLSVLLMALLFGGVSLADVVPLFLGILLSVALSGNLGLFFSATNRMTAVVITEIYVTGALLFPMPFGILLLAKSFGSAETVVSWLILFSPVSLMENLLFHATGLHDLAALAENLLLQQGLAPAAFFEFLLMALLLLAAVRVISPRRRKCKFTTGRGLIK